MIQIDFYHDRGDSPSVLLTPGNLPAIPLIGHTINAFDQSARWTAAAELSGDPVYYWRVTGVYWQLDSKTVSVFVVPYFRPTGTEAINAPH